MNHRVARRTAGIATATVLSAGFASLDGQTPAQQAPDLPPAGYGTLRRGDVGLSLQAGEVAVTVMPLDERVIRLLAPDTYRSFHRLLESNQDEIGVAARRAGGQEATLFLVTFFGRQPDARFDPDEVTVTGQNRSFRPVAIIPLSPSFADRQLTRRETATAIVLFGSGLRILDPFTVSYNGVATDRWSSVLRTLDRERASVMARAGERKPPN
jgi:hypothetical protein